MKRWLKSSISIFLGILILVTGSGLSLAKMVCVKSGYTQITLSEPDDCCKHEHEHWPVTLEEKCCDISSMDVAMLQYLVSSTQNIQKHIVIEVPTQLFCFDTFEVVVNTQFNEHNSSLEPSAPPIRIFTKSFLI
jgi:hypothetical protein